jgi:hypothetical protein
VTRIACSRKLAYCSNSPSDDRLSRSDAVNSLPAASCGCASSHGSAGLPGKPPQNCQGLCARCGRDDDAERRPPRRGCSCPAMPTGMPLSRHVRMRGNFPLAGFSAGCSQKPCSALAYAPCRGTRRPGTPPTGPLEVVPPIGSLHTRYHDSYPERTAGRPPGQGVMWRTSTNSSRTAGAGS